MLHHLVASTSSLISHFSHKNHITSPSQLTTQHDSDDSFHVCDNCISLCTVRSRLFKYTHISFWLIFTLVCHLQSTHKNASRFAHGCGVASFIYEVWKVSSNSRWLIRFSSSSLFFFFPAADSCRFIKCLNGQTCIEDQESHPQCIKCPKCLKRSQSLNNDTVSKMVCGMDGITYRSKCELRQKSCKVGRIIPMLHQGPCIGEWWEKKNKYANWQNFTLVRHTRKKRSWVVDLLTARRNNKTNENEPWLIAANSGSTAICISILWFFNVNCSRQYLNERWELLREMHRILCRGSTTSKNLIQSKRRFNWHFFDYFEFHCCEDEDERWQNLSL